MKIALAATALATVGSAVATDTNVKIGVLCSGFDVSKLSFPDEVKIGHIIQDTFNKVHGDVDGDDSMLSGVHFVGADALVGDDTPADENLGWSSSRWYWRRNRSYPWARWSGAFGCRNCPTDDDIDHFRQPYYQLLESHNMLGGTHKVFEAEFTMGLIASGIKGADKIRSCTLQFTPMKDMLESELEDSVDDESFDDETIDAMEALQDEADSVHTNVKIGVLCKGLDISKLSLPSEVKIGHIIQDTFNKVHGDIDGDDSMLSGVHFFGVDTLVGDETPDDENLGWSSSRWYWRRNRSYPWARWSGAFGCRNCPTDDDIDHFRQPYFQLLESHPMLGGTHKVFEAEFTMGLIASGIKGADKIRSCTLQFTPMKGMLESEEDQDIATTEIVEAQTLALASDGEPEDDSDEDAGEDDSVHTNVKIGVLCKGLDISKLSLPSEVKIGHIIQDTFNKVHGDIDGDDSMLSGVHFFGVDTLVGDETPDDENLGWSSSRWYWRRNRSYPWARWSGAFGCRNCPTDDDIDHFRQPYYQLLESHTMLGGTHKVFEAEFTMGLIASGIKGADKIRSCTLQFTPMKDMLETEIDDCGLRGCSKLDIE